MITGTYKGATLNANHCLYAPLALSFLKSEAGEGFFWFLVVIVTIIVQAVRASKQKSQASEEKESTVYTAPEDELHKFLESLGGQVRQRQEQTEPALQETSQKQAASTPHSSEAPLSASAAAKGDEKKRVAYEDRAKQSEPRPAASGTGGNEPRRRRYVSSVAAPKGKPSTIEKTELQVRKRKPERVETAVSVTEAQVPGIAGTAQGAYPNILKYLRSRNSLREAVVLREILGPPVALRSEPTQRITQ